MSFFGDLGTSLGDLFTGRWTGGETNLAHDNLTPLATLGGAAALGGIAAPEIAGLFGGGEAAAAPAVGSLDSLAAGGGVGVADAGTTGIAPALSGGGFGIGEGTGGAADAITGGSASFGDLTAPGTATAGAPTNIAPTMGSPTGGASNFLSTLTSPSQWTTPGILQGAGVAAAAGGLGANLIKGTQTSQAASELQNVGGFGKAVAGQQYGTGVNLESYLQSGTLPAPLQAQVTQWTQATKAKIVAGYGARGQPTQPGTNSALDQELAQVDLQALAQAGQLEQQLFTAGQGAVNAALQGAGISQQAYTTLSNIQTEQDKNLTNAIASFSGALVGPKVSLNFGGAKAA